MKMATTGESSIMDNLQVFVVIVAAASLILLIMCILMVFKCLRAKIKAKLIKARHAFIWNGLIRSIYIAYLTICIAAVNKLQESKTIDYASIAILVFFFGFFVLGNLALNRNRYVLEQPYTVLKIGNLYREVHIFRGRSFFSAFMIRRFFVIVLVCMETTLAYQKLQIFILLELAYLIYYVHVRPHISFRKRFTEIGNECFILMFSYHLITFSDFNSSLIQQFNMGYSCASFLGLMLIFNIFQMVMTTYEIAKLKRIKRAR
jgi:hypothetical protein